MRFMFYTDLHLSGQTPRHRVDDYPAAMLAKLSEAYRKAYELDCEFILFGGDYFNSHRVFSYNVVGDAMDVVCDSRLKTYSCIGEHDLYGHSPNTYPSSTLAFLARRCSNFVVLHEPIDLGDVVIHAKHEWEKMDEVMARPVDRARLNVLVCHELITNESAPFDVIHTSDLPPSPYDVVCSGDLHNGYEPHEVGETWFCNPGSMARQAINESGRWPQMAVVDVEKGGATVVEYLRLECAKPGYEVFGESIAEIARAKEDFDGEGFAAEMLDLEAASVDVYELIQTVGKAKGLTKRVLDYLATKRLSKEVA